MSLRAFPLTLDQANALVDELHRHHDPATGHRFSIGAFLEDGSLVGACIVGRAVAHKTPQYHIAEVSRLVTNGHRNACSFLYQSAARTAQGAGFWKIQTFILASESGASLRASGWINMGEAGGIAWKSRGAKDTHPSELKNRWERVLNVGNDEIPPIIAAAMKAHKDARPKRTQSQPIGRQLTLSDA